MAAIDRKRQQQVSSNPLAEQIVALRPELHAIAKRELGRERVGHTLQATALVNEAYLRLVKQDNLKGSSPARFLAAAVRTIRRVLVDHARGKRTEKRGGDRGRVGLSGVNPVAHNSPGDWLSMNEALETLRKQNKRMYDVVMLKYRSDKTVDEIAAELSVSPRTVAGDLAEAKKLLKRQLGR